MRRTMVILFVVSILLAACRAEKQPGTPTASPAATGEPYNVGAVAAITGPVASTYAPFTEGFRLYIRHLNARGGINGHPVNLVVKDSQANPSVAGALAKELFESNNALTVVLLGPSSNILPVLEQAKPLGAAVLSSTGCIDQQAPPDPDPLLFCTPLIAGGIGSHLAPVVEYIAQQGGPGAKVFLSALDIPASRAIVDDATKRLQAKGLDARMVVVPNPPPPDLGPFARQAIDFGAQWGTGGAPEEATLALFQALLRQGWRGTWVGDPPLGYDDNLERLKSDQFVTFFAVYPLAERKPFHAELEAAAREFGSAFPVPRLMYGWALGVLVETALRQCGWPCDRAKLQQAMNNLEVDYGASGIWPAGAKLKFTPTDHIGQRYQRLYKWDSASNRIVPVSPWYRVEHTGKREVSVTVVSQQ
jgi:ABC-type branched-subunit amino acid transport system substrate-binding protein